MLNHLLSAKDGVRLLNFARNELVNVADVKTAQVGTINVYDILKYNTVVASKAAVASIEEVYA